VVLKGTTRVSLPTGLRSHKETTGPVGIIIHLKFVHLNSNFVLSLFSFSFSVAPNHSIISLPGLDGVPAVMKEVMDPYRPVWG
jgi:hypothetical protein